MAQNDSTGLESLSEDWSQASEESIIKNAEAAEQRYYEQYSSQQYAQPRSSSRYRQPSVIEQKLTLAQYYQDLLDAPLYDDLSDPYANRVNDEIMKFIQSRLAELMGEAKPREAPFTDIEVTALRAMARAVLAKQADSSGDIQSPPPPSTKQPAAKIEQPAAKIEQVRRIPPTLPVEPERPRPITRQAPAHRAPPAPPPRFAPPPMQPQLQPGPQPQRVAEPIVELPLPSRKGRRGRRKQIVPTESTESAESAEFVGLTSDQLPKPIPMTQATRFHAELTHAIEAVSSPKISERVTIIRGGGQEENIAPAGQA